MIIHIRDLSFQCIIGILDFERTTPQDVTIHCDITYTFNNNFINYADVASKIEMLMQEKKFELIEEALNSLAYELKNSFKNIKELQLEIMKPDIMPNCLVSVEEHYIFTT